MSYVEFHRPAPFGATIAHRTTATIGELTHGLRRLGARRPDALAALGPDELEDIGLSVADQRAWRRPDIFARLVAAYTGWQARRRTIAELDRLSDSRLQDIGLLRVDIEALRRGRPLV